MPKVALGVTGGNKITRHLSRIDDHMKAAVVQVVKRACIWIENDALANVMGRVLTTRSGRLKGSIHHFTFGTPDRNFEGKVGTDVPYGKVVAGRDKSGRRKTWTITPKRAKALAVPTADALTGDGAPRYVGPLRQYNFRYIPKTPGNFPMLAEPGEAGGRILFILVPQVTIPPRPWLYPAKKKNVKRIAAELEKLAGKALKRK